MKWWSRRKDPKPPEGVRVVMSDGTEVPVDCVYVGLDDEGLHRWELAWLPAGEIASVRVRTLPARTTVAAGANS